MLLWTLFELKPHFSGLLNRHACCIRIWNIMRQKCPCLLWTKLCEGSGLISYACNTWNFCLGKYLRFLWRCVILTGTGRNAGGSEQGSYGRRSAGNWGVKVNKSDTKFYSPSFQSSGDTDTLLSRNISETVSAELAVNLRECFTITEQRRPYYGLLQIESTYSH